MILSKKDIGRLVLAGITVTLAIKISARLYDALTTQDPAILVSTLIGGALSGLILWALWSGQKWARYLLGYGHLLGGTLTAIIATVLAFDGKDDGFIFIPIYIWYAIIGALLIWAPGVSSYMRERRHP